MWEPFQLLFSGWLSPSQLFILLWSLYSVSSKHIQRTNRNDCYFQTYERWRYTVRRCVISAIQSCLTLCDPMDSLPGSSVHGIFQARILGCVAIPSSEDLPDPGSKPTSPVSPEFAGCGFFTTEPPGKPRNWLQWDYVLVVFLGDDFCLIL